MKLLIDFFAVIVFCTAYYIPDNLEQSMYVATAAATIATIIQVSLYWVLHRRFEKMHLITLAIILILGGLTLLLHDRLFFICQPTAVNWLFAIVFFLSEFIGSKTIIQRIMDHAISLPDIIWKTLNRSWTVLFIFSGAVNLYIVFSFEEHIRVNFKLFGLLGLTLIFAIGQAFYLVRHLPDTENGS